MVVSSAYLRLLIFLLAILIPSCASSSLSFFMMHSANKLNKPGDNIQPWRTPFPVWNHVLSMELLSVSGSNCCFLTCIQISQEAGKVVWYSHLLKNFPQLSFWNLSREVLSYCHFVHVPFCCTSTEPWAVVVQPNTCHCIITVCSQTSILN